MTTTSDEGRRAAFSKPPIADDCALLRMDHRAGLLQSIEQQERKDNLLGLPTVRLTGSARSSMSRRCGCGAVREG